MSPRVRFGRSFLRIAGIALLSLSLCGCLFSGGGDVVAAKVSGNISDSLEVEVFAVGGTGADGLLSRVRDDVVLHSTLDFSWTSYTSPYRNYWIRDMVVGTDGEANHVAYLLFDVTDTVRLSSKKTGPLFMGLDDPDSLNLGLELPLDTALISAIHKDTTLKTGATRKFGLSWRLVGRAAPKGADSLRRRDSVFVRELDEAEFPAPVEAEGKTVRDAKKRLAWRIPLPREVSEAVLARSGEKYRFLVLRVESSDAPTRVVSPFMDTSAVEWAPRLNVGDWAVRFPNRSAGRVLGDDPTSLVLRAGVSESLTVALPVESMLDSVPRSEFESLRAHVVRARLQLIASPTTSLEGDWGAVPLTAWTTLEPGAAEKRYAFEELQTGDFTDSAAFPGNWLYADGAKSDTLSVEITEAVRRALRAGSAGDVHVALCLGRRILDPGTNYLGSNQLRGVALDRVDFGEPSALKWRIEVHVVRPVEGGDR